VSRSVPDDGASLGQLLTESVVLAVMGGALGAVLAVIVAPWLARVVPGALPVTGTPAVDVRVWGFAALLTLRHSRTASTCTTGARNLLDDHRRLAAAQIHPITRSSEK
jgi:hypothetical protein